MQAYYTQAINEQLWTGFVCHRQKYKFDVDLKLLGKMYNSKMVKCSLYHSLFTGKSKGRGQSDVATL